MPTPVKISERELSDLKKEISVVVVERVDRTIGRGVTNIDKYPYGWAARLKVGKKWYQVFSARGERREFTDFDLLEKWLREKFDIVEGQWINHLE